MKAVIVEKIHMDMSTGKRIDLYALATSERIPESICRSLLYEAHLTAWTPDRDAVETLQQHTEREK